ncbi:MAG TPA: CBS domain-containing protein [Burkholderiales bacterium]|nr:CBS domain-containing protein [Burkholderiales bacterium]
MKISDICTREIVMADTRASLKEAATLMREQHVGTLLVVASDGGGMQAVGILTDRDLVIEAMARGLDAAQTSIGRLAEGKLAVVRESASVDDAIAAMKERGVRRLLVANEKGELDGIVSLDDLLDVLAHEMSQLARAVRGGLEREAAERAPLHQSEPRAVRIPACSYV